MWLADGYIPPDRQRDGQADGYRVCHLGEGREGGLCWSVAGLYDSGCWKYWKGGNENDNITYHHFFFCLKLKLSLHRFIKPIKDLSSKLFL